MKGRGRLVLCRVERARGNNNNSQQKASDGWMGIGDGSNSNKQKLLPTNTIHPSSCFLPTNNNRSVQYHHRSGEKTIAPPLAKQTKKTAQISTHSLFFFLFKLICCSPSFIRSLPVRIHFSDVPPHPPKFCCCSIVAAAAEEAHWWHWCCCCFCCHCCPYFGAFDLLHLLAAAAAAVVDLVGCCECQPY